MVGHTGVWDATIAALETIDDCLGRDRRGGRGASRPPTRTGRARCWRSPPTTATPTSMRDADGHPVTAHSLNPVPSCSSAASLDGRRSRDGVLADVAPTLLELAGLPRWAGHDRASLLRPRATRAVRGGGPVVASGAVRTEVSDS